MAPHGRLIGSATDKVHRKCNNDKDESKKKDPCPNVFNEEKRKKRRRASSPSVVSGSDDDDPRLTQKRHSLGENSHSVPLKKRRFDAAAEKSTNEAKKATSATSASTSTPKDEEKSSLISSKRSSVPSDNRNATSDAASRPPVFSDAFVCSDATTKHIVSAAIRALERCNTMDGSGLVQNNFPIPSIYGGVLGRNNQFSSLRSPRLRASSMALGMLIQQGHFPPQSRTLAVPYAAIPPTPSETHNSKSKS